MRPTLTALALSGCLLAAGCSSSPSSDTAAPPTAGAPAGAQQPAAAKRLTADQIAKALQARGLPMKNVIVYTAANDPNGRLGRPGQYSSKVSFRDDRVKQPSSFPGVPKQAQDVDSGGSVEVFDNASDAMARGEYIQTARRSIGMLGPEYDFVSGTALLRLAGALTPAAAAEYSAAFRSIVGAPLVTPSPTHT